MEQNNIQYNCQPMAQPVRQPGPEDHPRYYRSLAAAFIFSLMVNVLMYGFLKGAGLGINVPITVLMFYIARCLSMPSFDLRRGGNWVLIPFIILFSCSFLIYNNGFLLFLNLIGLIAVSGIQLALASGYCDIKRNGSIFREAIHNIFAKPFCGIAAFFRGIFKKRSEGKDRTAMIGIVVGISAALAVTIPVVALLASADSVFSDFTERIFKFDSIGEVIGRLMVFAVVAIFSGSVFTSSIVERKPALKREGRRPQLNVISAYIVSITLAIPLVIFSVIQCVYLTGAQQLPAGTSYSEYARSGFFQLCAAAVIVFAVIALGIAFTGHGDKGAKLGLNAVYTLLSLATMLLLVSAFWRMLMYERAFGYTRLRIYVQAFMILLGVITLFATVYIWLRKMPIIRMVFFCCLIGLCGLTYFNADGFIARHNSSDPESISESNFDTGYAESDLDYLLSLSVDALPEYADKLDLKDFDPGDNAFDWENSSRRETLANMYAGMKEDDIFTYNINRTAARACLEELKVRGFFSESDSWYY